MRILIVDDHAHLRSLARVYAEQAGATEIVDVADAGAALIAARAVPFDVAVLDFHMPGMDGLQATRELLALQPGLAVVAWTSVLDPAVERAFLEAGAVAHVPKMDTTALCRVIRERCPATTEPQVAQAA